MLRDEADPQPDDSTGCAPKIDELCLGHYMIERQIGRGGMGIVYLGRDLKLHRRVAIKMLPKEVADDSYRRARFEREARTAAQLNHPNIATIYEFGEAEGVFFIAMEFVDGVTLREMIGRRSDWPFDQMIDLAIQICQGLVAAHDLAIAHRDIKPGNIMVTSDNRVKILDFGLAKAILESRGCSDTSEITDLTRAGGLLGTVEYMSPEQARGRELDTRTDLFSLGVVLFEFAIGESPFRRDSDAETISSILNEPVPIDDRRDDLPPGFCAIIKRLLAKSPSDRYTSTCLLLEDLQRVKVEYERSSRSATSSEGASLHSIAVLAFTDMSPEKNQEYFCDGLAEELINALTHVPELRVAARTSTFQFKERNCDVREVGSKLKVNTVLEGSVRKTGNRIRVTAQLINVEDGYHLWSERYDRDLDDVFAIQDDIASTIVKTLMMHIGPASHRQIIRRYTENHKAYNLYLKGRFYWAKRYSGYLQSAIECFEEAIRLDKTYALAYCGLADCYVVMGLAGFALPKEMFHKAEQAACQALSLDDQLAEAHASLSYAYMWGHRDMTGGDSEISRALELNPNLSAARAWFAISLAMQGRAEQSLYQISMATTIDPLSPNVLAWCALASYNLGRIDDVIELCQQAFEIDPHLPVAIYGLAGAYLTQMKPERALEVTDRATGRPAFLLGMIARAHVQAGREAEARAVLQELEERSQREYIAPLHIAVIHIALGHTEAAFECLSNAAIDGNAFLYSADDPLFDNVRDEPHFGELISRLRPK